MILIEQTAVPDGALPVQALKDHLRLGSGFADDGAQDALLRDYLRSAMAAIEGRVGKALILRRFVWTFSDWRDPQGQALPLAPVPQVVAVTLLDRDGGRAEVDPARWRLRADAHRPRLVAARTLLPLPPTGGAVEIVFDAGFGPAWGDVPADLRQAVVLLAAQFHEFRHEAGVRDGAMPFGVMALIERWRNVRVLGGGGR